MANKAKTKINGSISVNVYNILESAISTGVKRGVFRAFKYEDAPALETIEDNAVREVMNELCEVFSFGDE